MVGKLSFVLGSILTAWGLLRVLPDIRHHRSVRKMHPDNHGNYDLDGVSYDPYSRNVVVTGDGLAPEPHREMVDEVVQLHAPEEPRKRSVGA